MGFRNLIFLQGEEATPALDMLDEQGPMATVAYLAEAAAEGDPAWQEISQASAAGRADRTFTANGYTLSWDRGGNYIGVERENPVGSAEHLRNADPEAGLADWAWSGDRDTCPDAGR